MSPYVKAQASGFRAYMLSGSGCTYSWNLPFEISRLDLGASGLSAFDCGMSGFCCPPDLMSAGNEGTKKRSKV